MAKQRILIVGDSFCAPVDDNAAWYHSLGSIYQVQNRGQAGVGQYKIHQQILGPEDYDVIIYLITSPYRIHCGKNPFYDITHPSHAHCDLIYNDVKSRTPDPASLHITWWFENIFDIKQSLFVHNLIVKNDCIRNNLMPISFFNCEHIKDTDILALESIWKSNSGSINHLSHKGHKLVTEKILEKIEG